MSFSSVTGDGSQHPALTEYQSSRHRHSGTALLWRPICPTLPYPVLIRINTLLHDGRHPGYSRVSKKG